jgi:GNAT superfamily N-acetyltransferase
MRMLPSALSILCSDAIINKSLDRSAEVSLYVHIDHRRQGLGKLLMTEIIKMADECNIHAIIGKLWTIMYLRHCIFLNHDLV